MSKSVPRPPDYQQGDRRQLPAPSFEPGSCRTMALAMILFWVAVIGGIVWLNN